VTLPAFAARRRRLLHGAPTVGTRRQRPRLSIDISAQWAFSSKLACRPTPLLLSIDVTDRRTDGPCSVSVNKS